MRQFIIPRRVRKKLMRPEQHKESRLREILKDLALGGLIASVAISGTFLAYGNGKNNGIFQGYAVGVEEGIKSGIDIGYKSGYNEGYKEGSDIIIQIRPFDENLGTPEDNYPKIEINPEEGKKTKKPVI